MLKTIPLDPELVSPSNIENQLPVTTPKRSRRYDKCDRFVRKRHHFRQRRRLPKPSTAQTHQLDPINLSNMAINPDQVNLLKKGPSFCPMSRDINWQCTCI